MPKLFGQPRPGIAMNDRMDDLGFKPGDPKRQEFYDKLRQFHQDEEHPHRRTLNTQVDVNLVDQEFLDFMHKYGRYFFGSKRRDHLTYTAKTYVVGTGDGCIFEDFSAVRTALLQLSRNYEKQHKGRYSGAFIRSDSKPYQNPDSLYTSSGSTSSETVPTTGSVHSSTFTGSENTNFNAASAGNVLADSEAKHMPSPTAVENPKRRPKPSRTLAQDMHRTAAAKVTDPSPTAAAMSADRSPTAEPWDASGSAVDWDNVQMETQIPTNEPQNIHYSTRSSARSSPATLSEQRTRKRESQDHDANPTPTKSRVCIRPYSSADNTPITISELRTEKPESQHSGAEPIPTKSKVCLGPRSTVHNKARYRSYDVSLQQPGLEVHLCVRNARNAFEKWPHGGLRDHTIDTFFEKVYDSCGLRGRLTSITFELDDADPPRHWTVKEGDAIMFEHVKDKTRRILAEGKYAGIFEILMEPTVEMDEEDMEGTIVLDI